MQIEKINFFVIKYKYATVSVFILVLLYFCAIFADFISPYNYDNESRSNSYNPPTTIHFVHEGKFHIIPFVYKYHYSFDEYYNRIFAEDKSKPYPICFFSKGDSYRLFGIIPMNSHLFGVDKNARIYLLGADSRGRDIFSRIIYGSRISLSIGIIGVMISTVIGLIVGGISGYFGGITDNLIMRFTEMLMLIPGFYLLLALRSAFPPELPSSYVYMLIIVILSFIRWAGFARVIRGMSKSISGMEFILAAKSIGQKDFLIVVKHIIPQTMSFVIVSVTLDIPYYILGESGLSLIGLGIQDPQASWGNMLSDAMNIANVKFHPWILIPGIFILVTVISFNLIGDALRDIFDPKSRS